MLLQARRLPTGIFCVYTEARGCGTISSCRRSTSGYARWGGDFGKWIVEHIDSWFAFARGLGIGIEHMEEIILVTGLHLTRSWANIVFLEGNVDGQASLGVKVNDGRDVSIAWRCSPGSVRGGMRSWGPGGKVRLASEMFRDNFSIILCTRLVSLGYCLVGSEGRQDPIPGITVMTSQIRSSRRSLQKRR